MAENSSTELEPQGSSLSLRYFNAVDKIIQRTELRDAPDHVRIDFVEGKESESDVRISRLYDVDQEDVSKLHDIVMQPKTKGIDIRIELNAEYTGKDGFHNYTEFERSDEREDDRFSFLDEVVNNINRLEKTDGAVVKIDGIDSFVSKNGSWTAITPQG